MPYTPFHPVVVWPIWKRFPARLDFVALTVGSVIPDLFDPFLLVFFGLDAWEWHRNLTSSLVGAVSYDLVLGILGTVLVARPLLYWLDRRKPSPLWSRYGGLEFRTAKAWTVQVYSVAFGTLSHVLLDVATHTESPLFWPFAGPIEVVPAELVLLDYAFVLVFGLIFVAMLWVNWWRPALRKAQKPK